jgi:hypothetical protein
MTMQNVTPRPDLSQDDWLRIEENNLIVAARRGTNWFYWIAGLTIINTIISLTGGGISFSVGLAFAKVVDAVGQALVGPARYALVLVDLIIAAVFVMFGVLGGKGQTWAILTGTILYVLDGLLLIGLVATGQVTAGILGFIIHGLAIYYLFQGSNASRKLAALRASRGVPGPPPPPSIISTMGNG